MRLRATAVDSLFLNSAAIGLNAGAAGRSQLRAGRRYSTEPDPIVLADAAESTVRAKSTLAGAAASTMTYTHAAEAAQDADLQVARLGVG